MARVKLVQERNALARRVRELDRKIDHADSVWQDMNVQLISARKAQNAAELNAANARLEIDRVIIERDAMRTERDRAAGLLKCAEAALETSERVKEEIRAEWRNSLCVNGQLRSAIVRLALALDRKEG